MPNTYWINGKKIVSEKPLSEDEIDEISQSHQQPKEEPGFLESAYNKVFTPPEFVTRTAQKISDYLTDPNLKNKISPYLPEGLGGMGSEQLAAAGTGFLGGAVEGLGGLLSPGNVGLTALGIGEVAAGKTALSGMLSAEKAAAAARTASNLGRIRQVTSAPVAAHGAINLVHGESTPMERLQAIPEVAGGLLGMKLPRFGGLPNYKVPPPDFGMPAEPVRPQLPSGEFRGLPEGDFVGQQPTHFTEGEVIPDLPIKPPINNIFNPEQVMQDRPIPYPDASKFTPEEFGQLNEFMGNGPNPVEINNLLKKMQGPTDPRITSISDEIPFTGEMPPSGEMGPPVEGFKSSPSEIETSLPFQQGEIDPIIEARANIEAARSNARQQVDEELGVTPQEQQGMRGSVEPQSMEVPSVKGPSGLSNVAMGGASPRVLDVLGSSLYSGSRPVVTTKELLQNAFDEHRIARINKPIKVLVDHSTLIPNTQTKGRSVSVSDRGRGLTPEQIYTKLTDVGETGKGDEELASGGFGFAKAAPFLGGEYTRIHSVVNEKGERIEYSFEGNPKQLKTQKQGVPLNRKVVGEDTPTGLTVTTWYGEDSPVYNAGDFAETMTELSGNITSPIKLYEKHGIVNKDSQEFLRKDNPNNYVEQQSKVVQPGKLPPLQDTISTPGADINIHFNPPAPGSERAGYTHRLLNKGMYQNSGYGDYAESPVPNVPDSIVTDIIATVEEGVEGYPFTANREQLDKTVTNAIRNWISKNIIQGALNARVAGIQRQYDSIAPISKKFPVDIFDDGNRLLPSELEIMGNSPVFKQALTTTYEIFQELILASDGLNWKPEFNRKSSEPFIPSRRIKKFGLLFQAPAKNGTITLGIHVPNPGNMEESAILVNIMEHLNQVADAPNALDKFVSNIFTTIGHEIAHVPGGAHDTGFAYRHAQLLGDLGRKNTSAYMEDLANAFGDTNTGTINPELLDLLQIYNDSRGRVSSKDDALLRTGIYEQRPPNTTYRTTGNAPSPNESGTRSGTSILGNTSKVREVYDLARGLTSVDLPFLTSAAFRQALPWVASEHWWTAWVKQAQAFGDKAAYTRQRDMLERDPLFSPRMTFKGNRATPELSWAEQAGLELTDLTDLTKREEVLRSTLAERIPVYGVYVRASNRAYTSFLNHVRANAFRDLAKSMGIWNGRQITDMPKAKELADFVNTTTGRGKLEVTIPGLGKTYNFEKSTEHLADIFFSPRLQTSRIKMLNPATYLHAPKDLRMQWIKALMTAVGSWWTITSLLELMGAKVSKDPNSSDFGKARIGNSRIDPGGGFQQYMVINHRILPQILGHTLAPTEFSQMLKPSHTGVTPVDLATGFFGHPGGGITSPISGQFHQYGQGYRPETAMSDFTRFTANKLHPIPRLAYDVLARDERHPVYVADRVMQLFLPMYASDIYEVYQDNPMLLAPMLVGSSIGMGTQTFEGGPGKPSITPMLGMDKYDMKLR